MNIGGLLLFIASEKRRAPVSSDGEIGDECSMVRFRDVPISKCTRGLSKKATS